MINIDFHWTRFMFGFGTFVFIKKQIKNYAQQQNNKTGGLEMKCPYCGKGLYKPSEYFAVCTNEKCAYHNFEYPIEVWRDLIAGEQARVALKVAVDALNDIVPEHEGLDGETYACSGIASRALIKINEITSITKHGEKK